MPSLVYFRLIGLTAGTLVQLFWMVVILGYRRQRNFERVFFFLCLALFLFYSGSLLALNAQIHYGQPPAGLREFVIAIISVGLLLVPALLMHLHVEFAETRGMIRQRRWKWLVLFLFYAAGTHLAIHFLPRITGDFNFVLPGDSLDEGFAHLFSYSLLWCSVWQFRFSRNAGNPQERTFHGALSAIFMMALAAIVGLHIFRFPLSPAGREELGVALTILPVVPLAALIYLVWRHNFLQIGRQKNLIYAVSATFLALLYLSLVRRVSGWLEPMLPPEASASILLFLLVVFIEPIQRVLGRLLQETAHREMDRVQRLTAEIQQEARQGDVAALVKFIERRTKDEFELAAATVTVAPDSRLLARSVEAGSVHHFRIGNGSQVAGDLSVQPHGAFLSGETTASIEFLCEQLPSALDLCRLIEEKLRLERELAERERLAVLGQMAASISHNLKNPLGSIKTILQVQLERPDVPESVRGETRMVLEEVRRLSAKLNQLLQFSRPVVRGGALDGHCDARIVIEEVVSLLRHEAEQRRIALGLRATDGNSSVEVSAEALSEVVSNLVVNALEATQNGGHVDVSLARLGLECVVSVEDDGPGIPSALHERVFQPFFTTKSKGTGLGLAIVARRVGEFRGSLKFMSPARDGKGTRFEVTLPSAARAAGGNA
jgi:signal transduction histidine kinase